MRFLVTGGAGFLGINLVRHLLAQGHQVRSYDIAPFDYPEAGQIDVLTGDIRNRDLHDAAFDGVDIVVHCAAALPLCTPEEIMSTDVGGTTLLLETALEKGIERFIHISSTAVYGVPDHHPLYEHDRLIGVGPYGEAKVEAEKVCAGFRDKGLCVPVLRPKSFVGPERLGVFELLYDFAYTGHGFPILGKGDNLYQLLDVEDLCDAISLCAEGEREAVNDVFNVGAAEFGSFRDSFQAVLDRAGHGKRIKGIPAGPAIMILQALEKLHLSPLYAWIYETAAKDSFVSIDKIRDRLGFVPKYSNRDALIRNYDWYVANRDHIAQRAGVTHRVPWKKGALELVRLFM
ncbi:NAD-dependent epimerase/dehydratase family protein [Thalassovita mangrovi]|uniref:NAD-dependent epimerase/dehydratase family protein n=1 Tax=Thalassovita mangrovi TaxID=2692236 RepID=A0A6L8LIX4_9RHOB|nr:NAD-dependent epimerase/dehydratase family protein [Thalassovita mangrovi]MYM55968.1 NAD-dependent epimerase/dehydratase family protein [Thalassovita mangrovi]